MNARNNRDFIRMYSLDLANYVNDVVSRKSYVEATSLAVYFVEMCEEVVFSHTKFPLIGTKLYGLTHNREQNSLDMNYLILQEVAGRSEMDYENILYHVDRFLARTEKGLRHSMIQCLPPFIQATRDVLADAVKSGEARGKITRDDLPLYLEAHNRAVARHLASRADDPNVPIDEYRSLEDIQESKAHLVFQNMSESLSKTLAAFVYLDAQGERYSQSDVVRLTGMTTSLVSSATEWLLDHAFINRDPRQRYYSTTVTFDGLTVDEARNLVNTVPVETEPTSSIENLTWLQGLIYATLQELAVEDDQVQIGGDELVTIATRTRWTASNGTTSAAISGLEDRGLIARNTGTKPYTYIVTERNEPQVIFSNVTPGDQPEVQEVLQLEPQDDVTFAAVEAPANVIQGGQVTMRPVEVGGQTVTEVTPSENQAPVPQRYSMGSLEDRQQRLATSNLELLIDDLIESRLNMLNPEVALDIITNGRVRANFDETTGTKTISFELSEDERIED
jgi:hypothetical protein